MWAETTHLGFKWHYYACMDDAVFDITEWAKCQVGIKMYIWSLTFYSHHNIGLDIPTCTICTISSINLKTSDTQPTDRSRNMKVQP